MSKEKNRNARLGLFVTVALILFAIVVYNIGSKQNLFGSTFKISSVFANVNGLQKGNNVRYSGINVGTVNDIFFISDSLLRVEMIINQNVQDYLKKDAIAGIGTDGLVGNMVVNISPGEGVDGIIEDGDEIRSFTRIEAEDMINTLGTTTDNIALLTLNLLEIAEKINNSQGSFNALISDSLMAEDMKKSIYNLKVSTQNMNALSHQFKESIEQVSEGKGVLGYLLNDSTFEDQLNDLYGNLDELITTRTEPILRNLEQSSIDVSVTTSRLKDLIQELSFDSGLADAILHDTVSAEELIQTLRNLNEGTGRFNQNMEALKHNFLFRRYFKKQEKEARKAEKQSSAESS